MTRQTRRLAPSNSDLQGKIMRPLQCALFAAVAVVGAASIASAADLPIKGTPYAPPPPADPWNWTGWWLGGDIGGVWAKDMVSPQSPDAGPVFPRSNTLSSTGIFGGFTVGFNWQVVSGFVLGAGFDSGGMQIKKSGPDIGGPPGQVNSIGTGWYGDAFARVGWAIDRVLFYGKSGLAFYDGAASTIGPPILSNTTITPTATFTGWTYGGGVEYKFAPDWSVRAEYLRFNLGSQAASNAATGVLYNHQLTDVNTVEGGIIWRFSATNR
jgi:outer membrane immunogenic protein